MYLKILKKKIEIKELNSLTERFKSLKFVLETIDYGVMLKRKRFFSTYFFCQRIDIIVTDMDDNITYIYDNVKSEKNFFHLKKVIFIFYH